MTIEVKQSSEQLLNEIRNTFEQKSSGFEQKLVAMNDEYDKKFESYNTNIMNKIAEERKAFEDFGSEMRAREAKLTRANFGGSDNEEIREEVKAFEKMLKLGTKEMRFQPEVKYLRTDVNTAGGYLAPTEYVNEIIKNITEISPVRQVARVTPTNRKSITVAKETSLPTVYNMGEGEAITSSDASYGSEEIFAHKFGFKIEISTEMLEDSLFSMRNEINSQIARVIAKHEGGLFINGTGVKQAEGLLTNTSIGYTASGAASTLGNGDALLKIQGDVAPGYNLAYMFNRNTLHSHIRVLKGTTNDAYLFQPALNGGLPATVAGIPYFLAQDMPNVGANTFPILCGDFFRGYRIVDNRNLTVKEDPFGGASTDKLFFWITKRTGGQVVLPEAIRKLKIATS